MGKKRKRDRGAVPAGTNNCPRCKIPRTPETLKIYLGCGVNRKKWNPHTESFDPLPPVLYAIIRCKHCIYPERTVLAPYFAFAMKEAVFSAAMKKDMETQKRKDEETKRERLIIGATK